MKQRRWCVVLLVLLALGAPRRAHAQRGVDAELFRPALDGYGIFTVDRARGAARSGTSASSCTPTSPATRCA